MRKTWKLSKNTKLLGIMLNDKLTWDENTEYLIKKAYKTMELLRRAAKFTSSKEEKKNIYVLYVRSILEQSCVVWHSSLTIENSDDLERVQKAAIKIILGPEYKNHNYEENLIKADLDSLKQRRINLCTKFANESIKNEKTEKMFISKKKQHKMEMKNSEIFKIKHANTTRLQKSAIPYMKRLLNLEKNNKIINFLNLYQ